MQTTTRDEATVAIDAADLQTLQPLIATLKRWQLVTPALLYIVGHRPLAFVAAQGLQLIAPLAAIAGVERVESLANVLGDDRGVAWLLQELQELQRD